MLRLSRKAWNNVLIFSMMIMIMLFNGLHKKFSSEPEETVVTLLPEDALVLTLKFEHTSIERIGQSWRANPTVAAMDELALENLMTAWLGFKANWHIDDNEAKVLTQGQMPQHFVIATLAGKSDGAVYAFYPQLESVWIHDQMQQRWLQAPIAQIDGLFPNVLMQVSP